LLRRRKAWLLGWATCALGGLSLLLLIDRFFDEMTSLYWLFGCLCLTAISGIMALVFRFRERPREVIVRRVPHWPGEPPVIHLDR
jgi:peptidoglycan/LPS O-acetylase OafA/YrhL